MEWKTLTHRLGLVIFCWLVSSPLLAQPRVETFQIDSEYQPTAQRLRVLLPDSLDLAGGESDQKVRLLYLLPVEEGGRVHWGDSLQEVLKTDIQNQYHVICVFPEFNQLPWYADHPTDKTVAQESYLLKTIIPFVDRQYSLDESHVERYLIGFSKSGWGAFSLLLRHPDMFQKAVAWDAPLMMYEPGMYGSGPIFGGAANFQNYQISRLLKLRSHQLGKSPRLISLGYDNFRGHHLQLHKLATDLKVPHIHRDGPQRKHHWESGWLNEAVGLMFAESSEKSDKSGTPSQSK